MTKKKSLVTVLVVLVVVIVLSCWVWSRWDAWFRNVSELPYTPPGTPHRVLLTFGGRDQLSRNVSWQCDTIGHDAWLELARPDAGDTVRIAASGEVFRSRSGQAAYYVARLRQLTPGSHYSYRAVTAGKTSPWYQFRVPPLRPDRADFLYVGDVQDTLGGVTNSILRQALARHPQSEFLVCGGDLTERPTNQHWEETFADIDSIGQTLPLLTVTGNHDYLKGVIMRLERRFPLIFSYFLDAKVADNQVYSLRYGPVQFFLLDSNRELPYLLTQRSWLEQQLRASTAPWKILVLHHPLFSIKGSNNLIQRWVFNDLVEAYGVDLVLQAHEHAYARMTRHDDHGRATTPVYTVSHCSPKNYRIEFSDRFDRFGISSRYYQTISIHADTLTLAAYEVYGHNLYDSLQIVKHHGQAHIRDLARAIPEHMEYTPDPNNRSDQAFAQRIADYKRRHPERLKSRP